MTISVSLGSSLTSFPSHSVWPGVCSSPTSFRYSFWNSGSLVSLFPRIRTGSSAGHRVPPLDSGTILHSLGKRRALLVRLMSTFRHLSISRHVFFVTTSPKQSVKSETLLISNNYRFSGHRSVGTKLAPPTLHNTDNPKGALSSPWVALMTFRCRVPFPVHIKSLLMA